MAALMAATMLASIPTVCSEEQIIKFSVFGEGWIIDKDECMFEANMELNGFVR